MTQKESQKLRKVFGNTIRKAREAARLTQAEVATKAGVDPSYYAEIERGEVNPTLDKIHGILKVLNLKSFDIS